MLKGVRKQKCMIELSSFRFYPECNWILSIIFRNLLDVFNLEMFSMLKYSMLGAL